VARPARRLLEATPMRGRVFGAGCAAGAVARATAARGIRCAQQIEQRNSKKKNEQQKDSMRVPIVAWRGESESALVCRSFRGVARGLA